MTSPGMSSGRDPLTLLLQQEKQRLPWLVPVRHRRMAESAFTFYRGAAVLMAADLGREPHSGLMVQLCGDAHLLNFGFYASPERQLLFDLNDFDETHPGPFEWDVIRLAASFLLAAQSVGLDEKQQLKICRSAVKMYAKAMAGFAAMPFLEMWVEKLPLKRVLEETAGANLRSHLDDVIRIALHRNSRQAMVKLCETDSQGSLQFKHAPPLVWRFDQLQAEWKAGMLSDDWSSFVYDSYLQSIPASQRHVFAQFRLSDVALKAVGVGSIGTRCAVSVWLGQHADDVLVIQGKQANASVLAPYIEGYSVEHQGKRVVQGQRLMQTASDSFLGWATNPLGDHLYFRQFRDWKASVDVSELDADGLRDYAKLCGWTLAKAHARSGDRGAIAGHIREPKMFAGAIAEKAYHHAELARADHRLFTEAIADGRLEVSPHSASSKM
jgi:uncharacterized protein (DUF2252 family)